MKKILLLIISIMFLTGCSKKMSLETPEEDVILNKNLVLKDENGKPIYSISYVSETYKPLTLSNSEKIKDLFEDINKWKYSEAKLKVSLCGFKYTINWGDNSIRIFKTDGNIYFFLNNKLYKLKSGNINFLEDYEFEVEN